MRSGYAFVLIWTVPPAKVPGISGVKVFIAEILSIIEVENKLRGTVLFSGSGLGIGELLTCVLVYLSPSPLTYTNFPPTTETPVTLLNASAALESPDLEINSELTISTILSEYFRSFNTPALVEEFNFTVTFTPSTSITDCLSSTFRLVVSPDSTFTLLTVFTLYPI